MRGTADGGDWREPMDGTVADRRLNILAVLSLFVVGCGHTPTAQVTGEQSRVSLPADGSLAITNVTLVDVASGARETAVTVVTQAGLIAGIGRGISIPREMEIGRASCRGRV